MGSCVTLGEEFETSQRASTRSEKSDFWRGRDVDVDDLADSPILAFVSWTVGVILRIVGRCVTLGEEFETSQRASTRSEKSDFWRGRDVDVDDLADSPILNFV